MIFHVLRTKFQKSKYLNTDHYLSGIHTYSKYIIIKLLPPATSWFNCFNNFAAPILITFVNSSDPYRKPLPDGKVEGNLLVSLPFQHLKYSRVAGHKNRKLRHKVIFHVN